MLEENTAENAFDSSKNPAEPTMVGQVQLQRPVSYEPIQVSTEELDEMLEQLEASNIASESECTFTSTKNSADNFINNRYLMGGARPKDSSLISSRSDDYTSKISNTAVETIINDSDFIEIQPDVVMGAANNTTATSKEDNTGENPKIHIGPPPYSEIDPMVTCDTEIGSENGEKLDRPTSLEQQNSK